MCGLLLAPLVVRTLKKDWKRIIVAIFIVAFSTSFPVAIITATNSALPTLYRDLTFSGIEDIRIGFSPNPFDSPSITNITNLMNKEIPQTILAKFTYYPRLILQFRTIHHEVEVTSRVYTINSSEDPLYSNLILDDGSLFKSFNENKCIVSRDLARKYNLKVNDTLSIEIIDFGYERVNLTILGIAHLKGVTSVYPISAYYSEFILVSQLAISKIKPSLRNKVEYIGVYLKNDYKVNYRIYKETLNEIHSWLINAIRKANLYMTAYSELKSDAIKRYFGYIESYKTYFLFITSFALIGVVVSIITTLLIKYYKALYQIGLLKAVGFKNKEITKLFLAEAIIIGFIGSSLGILFGIAINPIMRLFLVESNLSKVMFQSLFYDPLRSTNYTILIVPTDLIIIMLMSLLLVVITSIYPAIKASKVDPSIILRPRSMLDMYRKASIPRELKNSMLLSVYKVVKLWNFILKGSEDILYSFIKRRKHIYDAIVIFLAISVIVLSFTNFMIQSSKINTYVELYTKYGADIYAEGFIPKNISEKLTKIEGIVAVSVLEKVDLVDVYVDNISYIPEGDQSIPLSLRIINSSEVLNTLRLEYIANGSNIITSLKKLDGNNKIILSKSVMDKIGKSIGDIVSLRLTSPLEGNGSAVTYYEDNFTIVGYFNKVLPGVADEKTMVISKGNVPENLTIGCGALIKVSDLTNVENISKKISVILHDIDITIPVEIIKDQTELLGAYYAMSLLVNSVTVTLVTISLATILLSETIEQRYVFGVLYTLGFKKKTLYTMIIAQAISIGLISIIIGIILNDLFIAIIIALNQAFNVIVTLQLFLSLITNYRNLLFFGIILFLSAVSAVPSILEIAHTNFEAIVREINA
ncbi:MAG: FtsX-like permease family protein [Candidatus Asgardarchaeia archaeon]